MDGLTAEQTTSILGTLAKRIIDFDASGISDKALHTAKAGIADTIGVTLAGLPEPCTQIALQTPGVAEAPGPCLIFGTGKRTSALDATFVNGIASHALDFDDFSDVLGGHQSVPLVPALFALADEHALSGRDLITAYVIGFEVEHRFAKALHPHHYDKGWHPTATLGIFGTVAASARVLGLDAEQTTLAMAIAASLAGGVKANFGTMTKPLHIGHSGRCGLLAALMAERDFDANPQAMEHHQGFFNVFNGEGTFDTTALTEEWSDDLMIELPTIGIKQFPCCGSTHHAIQAMLDLVRDGEVTPENVEKIDIYVHGRRLRHTNTPKPTGVLQAKFSVQYAVVRALTDQAVRLKDFEKDAFLEPAIVALLERTSATPFGDNAPAGDPWDTEVHVTLKNGGTAFRRINNMVGRSGEFAMSVEELGAKFSDCAARALPSNQISPAFDALMNLEKLESVREAITHLNGG